VTVLRPRCGGDAGGGGHDWLEVTGLRPELDELDEVEGELVVEALPALVEVEATPLVDVVAPDAPFPELFALEVLVFAPELEAAV
jgi:hypothetical protein